MHDGYTCASYKPKVIAFRTQQEYEVTSVVSHQDIGYALPLDLSLGDRS